MTPPHATTPSASAFAPTCRTGLALDSLLSWLVSLFFPLRLYLSVYQAPFQILSAEVIPPFECGVKRKEREEESRWEGEGVWNKDGKNRVVFFGPNK